MIVNLGANACKYAGENGKIKVWARYNAEDRDVTIGVTDNGPGIAPEHVKLIFDRFQQLPKDKATRRTASASACTSRASWCASISAR